MEVRALNASLFKKLFQLEGIKQRIIFWCSSSFYLHVEKKNQNFNKKKKVQHRKIQIEFYQKNVLHENKVRWLKLFTY